MTGGGCESLRCQMLPDGLQFRTSLRRGFGPCHFEIFERIEDDAGDDEPGVLFAVCGNDVPGCVMGACGVQACLIGLRVILPVFPLMNIREAEFPVLLRLVDAVDESLTPDMTCRIAPSFPAASMA